MRKGSLEVREEWAKWKFDMEQERLLAMGGYGYGDYCGNDEG